VATSLRELVLAIKLKVDKTAVNETNVAFDAATKSAQGFETRLTSILGKVETLGDRLRGANTKLAEAFGMRTASHPAPPRKDAPNMAAPDLRHFLDTGSDDFRTGPQKALDGFKAKAQATFAAVGQSAQKFAKDFDSVAASIFNVRTALAGLAVVAAGSAIGHFFNDVIEAGGALHDMSQRTRVSVETLQVWRSVAADAGVDGGALEGILRKLNKSMAAAGRGSKLQAAAFKDLGVNVENADGSLRPIEEVLIDTGSALAQMDDDAKATALATQLLGPAGMGLVPAFNQGADAVRKLTAELKENVSLNAEEAARLDDVGDALARGTKKWTSIKVRIAVAVLPVLEALAGAYEKASKWTLRMAKETKTIQTVFLALTGGGLARLVVMFGTWVARVGGARAALALLGQGLRTAAGFAFRFLAPLLLIEDFLTFLAGGKSVFGRVFEEVFGPGGAKSVREGILAAFTEIGTYVNETLLPAFRGLIDNDLFKGAAKGALDAILAVLNLIGFALADNAEKAEKMAQAFRSNAAGLGLAPSTDERDAALKEGLPENRKELSGFEKFARGAVTSVFGDPLNDPAVKANTEANRAKLEAKQAMLNGIVPAPAAPPQPGGKPVTLNDQRKIEINVGGANDNAGAVGRQVGTSVGTQLDKDRRQTLAAVSG
jgi:hypothetical protein